MGKIRFVHWNRVEARERAKRLRDLGYEVDDEPMTPAVLKNLKDKPPTAVVIDLTRLPSHGRDLGIAIREYKATRHVPLVFVEGDPEKVKRMKNHLPDAVYTTWSLIRSELKGSISNPPKEPVVPASRLAGYSRTSLVKKLGIQTDMKIALLNAPQGFEKTLGKLPEGVEIEKDFTKESYLILPFTKSRMKLENEIKRITPLIAKGGLWIAWPKKTSGMASDLSEGIVQGVGLASGLVDYKICSINEIWSGLKFAKRKPK